MVDKAAIVPVVWSCDEVSRRRRLDQVDDQRWKDFDELIRASKFGSGVSKRLRNWFGDHVIYTQELRGRREPRLRM
jgi:hypothetical protein